jgi:hypothetical protein
MRFHHFVPVTMAFAALTAPLAARVTIGGFGTWAAFCDEPRKCFAISQPLERRDDPFLTVALDGRDFRVETHVGRALRTATLRVGDSEFDLTVSGEEAFADAAAGRRIVAEIRAAETLTISGRSEKGRFRHHYLLGGAPSAIDAAAIASRR